ncbi:MAG: hypothetical protein WC702_03340 [Patescibacteria group bacterium]|jgi:hypothetical protein
MSKLLSLLVSALGATLFSAVCLLPAYWLGDTITNEFGLTGWMYWWIMVAVWCLTCGGLAAAIGALPAIANGCSARSLWLRVVAMAMFTTMVGVAVFPDEVKTAVELTVFLAKRAAVAIEEVVIPTAAAAESEDDCRRGYDYVMGLARQSGDEMRGVPSRYDPSKSVAETVNDTAVAAPFILEHLSPAAFKAAKSQSAKTELVCRVLSVYGRKGSQAYRNEVNGNYLGPVQMSGGIYQSLRGLYPAAGLTSDSTVGRKDHLTAAKAARLHADSAKVEMSAAARKRIGSAEWWNRALIAAHNLEADQVSAAIVKYGTNWRKGHLSSETVDYLDMYVHGVYVVFQTFNPSDS